MKATLCCAVLCIAVAISYAQFVTTIFPKSTDPVVEVSTVTRMAEEMKKDAVAALTDVWRRHPNNYYEITKHLVTFFDQKYEPYWHASAGANYEAYFTFEKDSFIRMNVGKTHILLYKHYCFAGSIPERKNV